ncbi:MAG: translation elongation factor Ts, partial [Legionellales bacterium]|nr:translation elongation factor Ts [Legionellales bacterium]
MTSISAGLVKELRERTGAGMMECKRALIETQGDIEQAVDVLRKSGQAKADKKAGRTAAEGRIEILPSDDGQAIVMLEVNCETDFVARTEELKKFAHSLCMQIAAMRPLYLAPEDVDPKFLEHEKNIMKEQMADSGKPEKIINQIVEGKL